MLSGGEALEAYAVRSASSVLAALAKRMPSAAHRKRDGQIADVPLDAVAVGDALVVFPHEICPVDGAVVEGHGVMDESYLTGEPYRMSKAPGSAVLSGAVNGETALTIRCEKPAVDSRYAKIMQVMRDSEQHRPRLRRLGDQLGAWYTPVAVAIALAAWAASGDPTRFLAVLVVATPCPLLIAIPVAIIGSVSLSARRGIIIKDPAVLEKVAACRTAIFDKTGTLTYGRPHLTELLPAEGWEGREVLALVAGLERYSKHPLAGAVLAAAEKQGVELREAAEVSERPGQGLTGAVSGRSVQVTSRKKFLAAHPEEEGKLPAAAEGLECVVLIDGRYAAALRFRDQPRSDGAPFIRHLRRRHGIDRVILVSGDRESEVRYLAETVGIQQVYAGQTPEQKLEIVRAETRRANTVYLGDGVNDAPALTAATVGVAFGRNSDVTAEAAGAVILDSLAAEGGRVPAHRRPAADDRAAERRRRNGTEPDRNGGRVDGPSCRRRPGRSCRNSSTWRRWSTPCGRRCRRGRSPTTEPLCGYRADANATSRRGVLRRSTYRISRNVEISLAAHAARQDRTLTVCGSCSACAESPTATRRSRSRRPYRHYSQET